MKGFSNMKMISAFREISNTLEIVSAVIKILALVLAFLQALMLIKGFKNLPHEQ